MEMGRIMMVGEVQANKKMTTFSLNQKVSRDNKHLLRDPSIIKANIVVAIVEAMVVIAATEAMVAIVVKEAIVTAIIHPTNSIVEAVTIKTDSNMEATRVITSSSTVIKANIDKAATTIRAITTSSQTGRIIKVVEAPVSSSTKVKAAIIKVVTAVINADLLNTKMVDESKITPYKFEPISLSIQDLFKIWDYISFCF